MKYVWIVFVVVLVIVGCNENSSDSNPADPNTENHAPVIHSVTASPETVGRQQETELHCTATDSDGDSLDFDWSATSGDLWGDDDSDARWDAPNVDGQYWIHVTVNDGRAIAQDSVQVTVIAPNGDPGDPYDPQPASWSQGNPLTVDFSWKCFDADGDDLTYDFYFTGGQENPDLYERDLTLREFQIEGLLPDSWYSWKVVARDSHGNQSYGQTWYFSTGP